MITVLFVEDWGFKAEINPQMYTFWSYTYKFRFKPCFLFFLNWAFYWQWRTNKYSLYQNKVLEQLCRKEFPDGVALRRTRGATWALGHSHAVHGFRILKLCFGFLWKCVKMVRKKNPRCGFTLSSVSSSMLSFCIQRNKWLYSKLPSYTLGAKYVVLLFLPACPPIKRSLNLCLHSSWNLSLHLKNSKRMPRLFFSVANNSLS